VLNLASVHPLDREAVLAAARGTRGIVTVEESVPRGGLGGAVAELLAEEVLEISDDVSEDYKADGSINYELVARSKLRADNRKWLASKLDPARFSDKVQTDITSGGERIEVKEISPIEQARQVAFALELAKRATPPKED